MARKLSEFTYSALGFFQRDRSGPQLVLFHAPVRDILKWSAVGVLGPQSTGPQRERKEARVEAVRKFLAADSQNIIPTAVVLAFDEGHATFRPSPSSSRCGELYLSTRGKPAATIVDGQHRLHGANAFGPKTEVAVVGLLAANEVEKAFQFLVINNKASRVSTTHTKALLARMRGTKLPERLRGARLAFDAEGINDVDLVNSEPDSPFHHTIDWPTTPKQKRMVQATAVELSLKYLEGLGIPEYDDRDTRRSVFLAIWKVVRTTWTHLWTPGSRLVSKVGVICLTRFVADLITRWADNEQLDIEVTDLAQIEEHTTKILKYMDPKFWSTPWAEKAQGGFDTNQGRERVIDALQTLYRNGRRDVDWYDDIDIVERASTD